MNQLLTEMDGFEGNKAPPLIAAGGVFEASKFWGEPHRKSYVGIVV